MIKPSSAGEWREIVLKSLETSRTAFMQLATITAQDKPSVRTVVFRGWNNEDSNKPGLKFITDSRSSKMAGRMDWAEVCYYCEGTREQFRFTGSLTLAGSDAIGAPAAARTAQWAALSDTARAQFCWATPGEPRQSDAAFAPEQPSKDIPVQNFVLLVLECRQVDHYNSEVQTRDLYRLFPSDETWSRHSLNP